MEFWKKFPAIFYLFQIIAVVVCIADNLYFGSKTPYDLHLTNWAQVAKDAQISPTCQLVHVRLVARHGTRTLDEDKVEEAEKAINEIGKAMAQFVPVNDRELTEQQINSIISWKNQLPVAKELLPRGRNEHRFLAQNFHELIKQSSALSKAPSFRFESTNVSRARESALAFKTEWSKLRPLVDPNEQPVHINDKHLYYHKNCFGYINKVAKNSASKAEAKRAKSTKEGSMIVEKVNRDKLGFASNILSWKNIFALYEMTAFEMASLNASVLLPLFDHEDLVYLEFADDLEQYWLKAYSRDSVTRDMSCILTSNIFETAQQAHEQFRLGNYDTVESVFSFAHLETLLPVFGAFGLFHDEENGFLATASRFYIENRQYDTSKMGKMASNMAFLFYDCPNFEEPRDKLVLLMVNGKPQPMPKACPFELACPMETIIQAYPLATGKVECKFEQICSQTGYKVPPMSASTSSDLQHTDLLFMSAALLFRWVF